MPFSSCVALGEPPSLSEQWGQTWGWPWQHHPLSTCRAGGKCPGQAPAEKIIEEKNLRFVSARSIALLCPDSKAGVSLSKASTCCVPGLCGLPQAPSHAPTPRQASQQRATLSLRGARGLPRLFSLSVIGGAHACSPTARQLPDGAGDLLRGRPTSCEMGVSSFDLDHILALWRHHMDSDVKSRCGLQGVDP